MIMDQLIFDELVLLLHNKCAHAVPVTIREGLWPRSTPTLNIAIGIQWFWIRIKDEQCVVEDHATNSLFMIDLVDPQCFNKIVDYIINRHK